MRLRYRMAAFTLLILLPVVATSVVALVHRSSVYLWDEEELDAVRLAQTVVRTLRHEMGGVTRVPLKEVLSDLSANPDVKGVRFYNGSGKLEFPRDVAAPPLNLSSGECAKCHADPQRLSRIGTRCIEWKDRILRLHYGIRNEPRCAAAGCHASPSAQPLLGILQIDTDHSAISAKVRKLRLRGIFWGCVVLLAAALPLFFVFGYLVEKPLAECLRLVREVSEDNLRVKSRIHPADEWGDLLRSFDAMVFALFRARVALEALNRDLEGQVSQRTRELESALDVARESDRMKTEFLANLSHEFSTPIQGVIGYAQLLLDGIDGELSPSQREDVEKILRSGRRLLDWVEDLLELARLDGQRRILCVDRLRIEELAEEAAEAARRTAEGKPVEVVYRGTGRLPLVFGEVGALRRVLFHLAENAARHTERGRISLAVVQSEHGWVDVTIEDTGPGIDPALLEAALKGFASKSGGGGLAVGLSLARRLIELHQGTMEIQSAPGEGTKIRLRVPTAPPEEPEEAGATREQPGK